MDPVFSGGGQERVSCYTQIFIHIVRIPANRLTNEAAKWARGIVSLLPPHTAFCLLFYGRFVFLRTIGGISYVSRGFSRYTGGVGILLSGYDAPYCAWRGDKQWRRLILR